MIRRNFLSRALSLLAASKVLAQQPVASRVTNDDLHGMPTNRNDMPQQKQLAGEDAATMKYSSPNHSANGSQAVPKLRTAGPEPGVVPVTTRSFDNARSGCNLAETTLKPQNLAGLRKLYNYLLPDDARGMEAQPLIVPKVKLRNGRVRDLAILATMGNTVYAYDAHDPKQLYWSVNLGDPVRNSAAVDAWMINDNWGILSTPVIDPDTNTLYCVTWSSPDATLRNAVHTFHSIQLSDGSPAAPPLSLEGAVYQPGNGLPVQQFKSSQRKQRSSLTLTNVAGVKTVFIPFGTILEIANNARGWIIAVDVASNKIGASFTTSARYSGGGIWMAGQGLASDSHGFLYALTSNGSFDARTEWGECFLKLQYIPPSGVAPGAIRAADWWSPFSDSGRAGGPPTGDHITNDNGNGWDDMDLGSGGVVLIPQLQLVAGAGKDGILYVLRESKLGRTVPADFANPAQNYAKLAAPPEWLTYFNPGASPAPRNFTDLNQIFGGRTHHQHSTPVVFESANHGVMLFIAGENGNLRAWNMNRSGVANYLACGAEVSSVEAPVPPGGMPGMMLSLSANGRQNAIVWACVPLGDANKKVTQGYVAAYDATNIGTYSDGSGALKLLWKSPNYTYNKFNVAVVSGGKLYVPTYDGKVDVYGLDP